MEVALLQVKLRDDVDRAELQKAFEYMVSLVSQVPGFIGMDGFSGEDGSQLLVARFASGEALATWRNHPEHVKMQARGREEFFDSGSVTVATVSREYGWPEGG